jgi:hypothetical protein
MLKTDRLIRLLCITIILISAPLAILRLNTMFERWNTQRELTVDEPISLYPAISVFQNGWSGFRCNATPWYSCYGGATAMADGALLKLMPRQWLEEIRVTKPEGARFPKNPEFPKIALVLTIFRGVMALALLAALFVLAKPQGILWGLAIAAYALISTNVPIDTVEPIKVEFPTALSVFFLFLGAHRIFSGQNLRKKWDLGFAALGALTALAFSVRITGIIFGGILILGYGCSQLALGRGPRLIVRDAVIGLLCFFGVYFVLNPGLFFDAKEVLWFRVFFHSNLLPTSFAYVLSQVPDLSYTLPLVLVITPLLKRIKSQKMRIYFVSALFSVFTTLVLNLKAYPSYPYYYLSSFIASLVVFHQFLTHRELPGALLGKIKLILSISMLGIIILVCGPRLLNLIKTNTSQPISKASDRDRLKNLLNKGGQSYLLDVNLRLPLEDRIHSINQIEYFDSLADTPGETLKRIENRNFKIVLPCWNSGEVQTGNENSRYTSPTAIDWAQLVSNKCKQYTSIVNSGFRAFQTAAAPGDITTLTFEDLTAQRITKDSVVPRLVSRKLEWQIFKGRQDGADTWSGMYCFDRPFHLKTEFKTPWKTSRLQIVSFSSCKRPAQLKFVSQIGRGEPSTLEENIDSTMAWQRKHHRLLSTLPQFVRSYFFRWASGGTELPPIEYPLVANKGDLVTLRISGDWESEPRCSVCFFPAELK